jgi:hypothetical protein
VGEQKCRGGQHPQKDGDAGRRNGSFVFWLGHQADFAAVHFFVIRLRLVGRSQSTQFDVRAFIISGRITSVHYSNTQEVEEIVLVGTLGPYVS